MDCQRCHGLMVCEPYVDLLDLRLDSPFMGWRCVSCGEIWDPVIALNRIAPPQVTEEVDLYAEVSAAG